jgi:putative tricarboxylic transport membrane protein
MAKSLEDTRRTLLCAAVTTALLAWASAATTAAAQDTWKPTRPVTLIVPNAAGGNSDRLAREMQGLLQAHRMVEVPVVVVNRAGGAGTIALNQLLTSPPDGHVLLIGTPGLLSNHITGLSPHNHTDITTLVLLLEDYYGVNVRPDSPIKSPREMLERFQKSPDALAVGTTSVAGGNHTSLIMSLKQAGVDVKRVKTVTFAGGGQSTLALLGGHVDILSTGLSNMAEHLQNGKMRLLVHSGPKRKPGLFAEVPTWREIGVDVTIASWRTVIGPKDLKPAQVAYWEGVFKKLVQSEQWKKEVADNHWENTYLPAAEARRRLDREYAETRQILAELGLAK